jgi:hypothetical protein
MELWVKLVLGSLALLLVAQAVAGSDGALRTRRWAPLLYVPLMLVAALDTSGTLEIPAGYLWHWAAITLGCDQLLSEVRLDWRNRRHRQPVA